MSQPSRMPQLPEEILCSILGHVPFGKAKIRWIVVNRKWKNAMLTPSSHPSDPIWFHSEYLISGSMAALSTGLLRVLPDTCGAATLGRVQSGGLENLRTMRVTIQDLLPIWSHCDCLDILSLEVRAATDVFQYLTPKRFPSLKQPDGLDDGVTYVDGYAAVSPTRVETP